MIESNHRKRITTVVNMKSKEIAVAVAAAANYSSTSPFEASCRVCFKSQTTNYYSGYIKSKLQLHESIRSKLPCLLLFLLRTTVARVHSKQAVVSAVAAMLVTFGDSPSPLPGLHATVSDSIMLANADTRQGLDAF